MFFGVFSPIYLWALYQFITSPAAVAWGQAKSPLPAMTYRLVCVCFVWKSECVRDDDVTGALVAQPKQQTHHRTHNQHTLCQLVS
jgi:hypothetical protein